MIERAVVGQLVDGLGQDDVVLFQKGVRLGGGEDLALHVGGVHVLHEITPVVHKAHHPGPGQVLPGPILGGELAVLRVFDRDVLPLVVPLKAQVLLGQRRAHLHRQIALQRGRVKGLVGRDQDRRFAHGVSSFFARRAGGVVCAYCTTARRGFATAEGPAPLLQGGPFFAIL